MDIPEFLKELGKIRKYFKWEIIDGQLTGQMHNLYFCPLTALYAFKEHAYLRIIDFKTACYRLELSDKDSLDLARAADYMIETIDEPITIMLASCVGIDLE